MPSGQISKDSIRVSSIIPKELKQKTDHVAYVDGRSLSGWIKKLIINEVDKYEKGIKGDTE